MKRILQLIFAIVVIAASATGAALAVLALTKHVDGHTATVAKAYYDANFATATGDAKATIGIAYIGSFVAAGLGGIGTLFGIYYLFAVFTQRRTHMIAVILTLILGASALILGAAAYGCIEHRLIDPKWLAEHKISNLFE